jgi:hypothetical protein
MSHSLLRNLGAGIQTGYGLGLSMPCPCKSVTAAQAASTQAPTPPTITSVAVDPGKSIAVLAGCAADSIGF